MKLKEEDKIWLERCIAAPDRYFISCGVKPRSFSGIPVALAARSVNNQLLNYIGCDADLA